MSARRPSGRREAPAARVRTEETQVCEVFGMESVSERGGRMMCAPLTKYSCEGR